MIPLHPRGMWYQWGLNNPELNLRCKFSTCNHPKLIIALLMLAGLNYGQTGGRTTWPTNGHSDDPNTRCPGQTFQEGGGLNNLMMRFFPMTKIIYYQSIKTVNKNAVLEDEDVKQNVFLSFYALHYFLNTLKWQKHCW